MYLLRTDLILKGCSVVGLCEVSLTCRAVDDHVVALTDDRDGEAHTSHIVATHLAGHLIFARSKRFEGVVDTVNCARINQVDTNEHIFVLCVLIERSAIRFIGDEGESVIVIATIGDNEMVRDANPKDFHRGNDFVVDKQDIDGY